MLEVFSMITAKTCSLTPVGGRGEITREMVAAACRALNNHAMQYAMVKFAGDDGSRLNLDFAHELYIRDIAKLRGWEHSENDTDKQMKLLCHLVLEEALNPSKCVVCQGRGEIAPSQKLKENEYKPCRSCNETGRGIGVTVNFLQTALGCTRGRAKHFWFPRFQEILSDMEALESEIDFLIKKELFGD